MTEIAESADANTYREYELRFENRFQEQRNAIEGYVGALRNGETGEAESFKMELLNASLAVKEARSQLKVISLGPRVRRA